MFGVFASTHIFSVVWSRGGKDIYSWLFCEGQCFTSCVTPASQFSSFVAMQAKVALKKVEYNFTAEGPAGRTFNHKCNPNFFLGDSCLNHQTAASLQAYQLKHKTAAVSTEQFLKLSTYNITIFFTWRIGKLVGWSLYKFCMEHPCFVHTSICIVVWRPLRGEIREIPVCSHVGNAL